MNAGPDLWTVPHGASLPSGLPSRTCEEDTGFLSGSLRMEHSVSFLESLVEEQERETEKEGNSQKPQNTLLDCFSGFGVDLGP